MSVGNILAVLVVFIACPLNWLVAVLLWGQSKAAPELRTLRDRAIAGTAVAVAVTAFAILMVNNDLPLGLFDSETAKVVSRFATLALSIAPAFWWLRLYLKGES